MGPFPGNIGVLCTQLGNYAVKIIQMTLDIRNTPTSVKICINLSK